METKLQTPPGSGTQESDQPLTPPDVKDTTPHHSADPICAALYAETTASAPPSATGSAAKCPIRYLDQHSPEEVAAYFETHKHEIPRSHEVCVRRYQRNESDIRKLDAKYGSLVNMIQGLGQKHQPLLPSKEEEEDYVELEHVTNHIVENWAQAVSADGVGPDAVEPVIEEDSDRESRFDRTLKEIRVGESPSRPWGISVPIFDPPGDERPRSPSPARVLINHMPKPTGKCPFGHGQEREEKSIPLEHENRPIGKYPFGGGQAAQQDEEIFYPASNGLHIEEEKTKSDSHFQQPPIVQQPTFFNSPQAMMGVAPQMVFTGPVFIGYPMEQALAFMQQYKATQ